MRPARQKILVTGGGGFLGGAIVRQLRREGHGLRSLARHHYPELSALDVEQVLGDIGDAALVSRACEGMEVVFHAAAKPGVWGSYSSYYDTNVMGTANVIEACRHHGIQRLIYTSSPSVIFNGQDMEGIDESAPYPDHYLAHYPRTKALAEQAVRQAAAAGLTAIILRPHLIWGPRDNHLVPRIIQKAPRLAVIGDGTKLVDTVYIDNAARAHVLADQALAVRPELSGRTYFISNDEPLPLWEMVNCILAAAGKAPIKRRISLTSARCLAWLCEGLYRGLDLEREPPLTRFVVEELATAHWFDLSAARKDLGYEPVVSIAEGLRRLKVWLQTGAVIE